MEVEEPGYWISIYREYAPTPQQGGSPPLKPPPPNTRYD